MNNVNTKHLSKLVEKECPVCSVIYYADKTRLKHGRQTTCSRKCSYKLRAAQLNKTKLYYCAVCNNKVYRSPAQVKSNFVFCSPQCHYKARSLGLVKRVVDSPYKISDEGRLSWKKAAERRNGILYKDPISWVCETCGKQSIMARGKFTPSRKLRFCSQECANLGLAGDKNPAWRGGQAIIMNP